MGALFMSIGSCVGQKGKEAAEPDAAQFVRVAGPDLIEPDGDTLHIVGTNLGNWLNPEGYMFGFGKCNSYGMIDLMFRELVGPDATAAFWQQFKESYITRDDIRFIARTGANTIRMPFHYKLFTDEDYMGLSTNITYGVKDGSLTRQYEGFARMDSVISWCREAGLYLILDMHDCPGGQTGDNIDDSHGYPWLFTSEASQQQFIDIWKLIAGYYSNEPVILGYELMNEPLPHYLSNLDELGKLVEPLYKRTVEAIREVDQNHIILLGGIVWNSVFEPFTDWTFDDKLMYTCHRYGGPATREAIQSYIDFRDKTQLPMYMGEIGHNTMQWQADFSNVMREANIGYTFWPYKKMKDSCMNGFVRPEGWQMVVDFAETDRSTYALMQAARPDQQKALELMQQLIENVRYAKCVHQNDYIESMLLKAE